MSMAHGKGTYTNTMGAIYEGEWRYDMQHGHGTEKWTNSNSVFEGEFVDGLRNGYGTWFHKNKSYRGYWKNNMMDGQGTMEWGIVHTNNHLDKSQTGRGSLKEQSSKLLSSRSLVPSQLMAQELSSSLLLPD